MTDSWHVVAKLLTLSRMSKVDYRNKVLPIKIIKMYNTIKLQSFYVKPQLWTHIMI